MPSAPDQHVEPRNKNFITLRVSGDGGCRIAEDYAKQCSQFSMFQIAQCFDGLGDVATIVTEEGGANNGDVDAILKMFSCCEREVEGLFEVLTQHDFE